MKSSLGRAFPRLETLEAREVPATLVNSTTLSYQDMDGDNVTVSFSKSILNAANVNSIFAFDTSNVSGSNAVEQQLDLIDLASLTATAGTNITVKATPSPVNGGDGFADVGEINATGINLGVVNIGGDLGKILAGNGSTTTPGLSALTVQSMGQYGVLTGATDLLSVITGSLTNLTVKSDVTNAEITASGSIGSVYIGGSLIGGTNDNSGSINSTATIGPVSILGDVIGGAGNYSGSVISNGTLTSVTIGGSLRGGSGPGEDCGFFRAGSIGSVKITGDIDGGDGTEDGYIEASNNLGSLTVGGSLRGGAGDESGDVSVTGNLGSVSIVGGVIGGDGTESGDITANGTIGNVTIGSLEGGNVDHSGDIDCNSSMGVVTVRGDLDGGSGSYSGALYASGAISSLSIGGSIRGGSSDYSGSILAGSNCGPVSVAGGVIGGGNNYSGSILAGGKLGNVKVGYLQGGTGAITGTISGTTTLGSVTVIGAVTGGQGPESGLVNSNGNIGNIFVGGPLIGGSASDSGDLISQKSMGSVKIAGDVVGGGGASSGEIYVNDGLASVIIGGSLIGTSALVCMGDLGNVAIGRDVEGTISCGQASSIVIGGSLEEGGIHAVNSIQSLTIDGDILGGSASGSDQLTDSGYIQADQIVALTVGGSIVAGTNSTTGTFLDNGAIRVAHDFGKIAIKGSLEGNSTNPVIISAMGSENPTSTTDTAIGSITVGGSVDFTDIAAGVDVNGDAADANAQIGNVLVDGDWIASSIAAGVTPGFDTYYGTLLDKIMSGPNVKDVPTVISKINSVTIEGEAMGTYGGFDYYGIVAQEVGSVKIGNVKLPLKSGADNDVIPIGITQDFDVREV
jgi:hypothetical protein